MTPFQQPFQLQPRQPMVYVYEPQRWEYKVVARNSEEDLSEADFNGLGLAGWELAGIVTRSAQVHFYFKRVRK